MYHDIGQILYLFSLRVVFLKNSSVILSVLLNLIFVLSYVLYNEFITCILCLSLQYRSIFAYYCNLVLRLLKMKLYVYKINNFMVLGYHFRGMMTVYNLRNRPFDNIQEAGN